MAASDNAPSNFAAIALLVLFCVSAAHGSDETDARWRYQRCVEGAAAAHDAARGTACKRLAEEAERDRADCLAKLNLPKTYCDVSYPSRDNSPSCILPGRVASALDADLQRARYRCERELQAAAP